MLQTIFEAIDGHAHTQGNSLAYTLLAADESATAGVTYSEIDQNIRGVAHRLRQEAEPGARALVLLPFGIEFLQVFLACLYAGIIAVPAYPPRRTRGNVRLQAIADDCQPSLLLCDSRNRDTVDIAFAQKASNVRTIVIEDLESPITDGATSTTCVATSDDVAYLQYTSGSTAAPKGVAISHGNLVANLKAIQHSFGNSRQSIGVLWLPLFHDMGLVSALQTLFVGYHNVLLPTNVFVAKPATWLRAISRFGGTVSGGPNFAYQLCVDRIPVHDREELDLSSWCVAYDGAEPIRCSTLDQFHECFSNAGFRRSAFFPCYGLAESTLFVAGGPSGVESPRLIVDRRALESSRVELVEKANVDSIEMVSCGRLDPSAELLIVDPGSSMPRNDGHVGEIWLRGPSIARGYWGNVETPEADFTASPGDQPEIGFLQTGDLGFLHDGELYVTGRRKDLVIVNGRNVYPQDIESEFEVQIRFAMQHGTAAFGIDDGRQEHVVIVAEASRQSFRATRDNDLSQLATEVDRFRQAIWNSMNLHIWEIAFVRPGTFPRTTSGKIQRRVCRDGFLNHQLNVIVRIPFKGDPERVL